MQLAYNESSCGNVSLLRKFTCVVYLQWHFRIAINAACVMYSKQESLYNNEHDHEMREHSHVFQCIEKNTLIFLH